MKTQVKTPVEASETGGGTSGTSGLGRVGSSPRGSRESSPRSAFTPLLPRVRGETAVIPGAWLTRRVPEGYGRPPRVRGSRRPAERPRRLRSPCARRNSGDSGSLTYKGCPGGVREAPRLGGPVTRSSRIRGEPGARGRDQLAHRPPYACSWPCTHRVSRKLAGGRRSQGRIEPAMVDIPEKLVARPPHTGGGRVQRHPDDVVHSVGSLATSANQTIRVFACSPGWA